MWYVHSCIWYLKKLVPSTEILNLYSCHILFFFFLNTTYVQIVPTLNVLQANQEWPASFVSVGISRNIPLLLRKFQHVWTCTAIHCNGSQLCYARHFHRQFSHTNGRAKIEHQVLCETGKSATETYNSKQQVYSGKALSCTCVWMA